LRTGFFSFIANSKGGTAACSIDIYSLDTCFQARDYVTGKVGAPPFSGLLQAYH
jgi:hypothetical protein